MNLNTKQAIEARNQSMKVIATYYPNDIKYPLKSEVCAIDDDTVYFTDGFELPLQMIVEFESIEPTAEQNMNYEKLLSLLYK